MTVLSHRTTISEAVVLVRSDKYFCKETRMCCWKLCTFLSTIMHKQAKCYVPNGTSCYVALSCDKVTEVEGHHKKVT